MWPHECMASPSNILKASEEKEGWFLLSVKDIEGLEDVVKPIGLHSVLGHHCRTFKEGQNQLLGVDDTMAGMCWWCKDTVPEDLKGLWLLHNFEAAGQSDPQHVRQLLDEVADE